MEIYNYLYKRAFSPAFPSPPSKAWVEDWEKPGWSQQIEVTRASQSCPCGLCCHWPGSHPPLPWTRPGRPGLSPWWSHWAMLPVTRWVRGAQGAGDSGWTQVRPGPPGQGQRWSSPGWGSHNQDHSQNHHPRLSLLPCPWRFFYQSQFAIL